jgi:hypothetical protein
MGVHSEAAQPVAVISCQIKQVNWHAKHVPIRGLVPIAATKWYPRRPLAADLRPTRSAA